MCGFRFNHRTANEHVHIEGTDEAKKDPDEKDSEDEDEAQGAEKTSSSLENDHPLEIRLSIDNFFEFCSTETKLIDWVVRVVQAVASGAELFNTFGERSNASLLCKYGFAEHDNPYDVVHLSQELLHKVHSRGGSKLGCMFKM